jgi:hypothetical protein
MSAYIESRHGGDTNVAFLNSLGKLVASVAYGTADVAVEPPESPDYLVCLVDNGQFCVAPVIYNDHELSRFNRHSDMRPKSWFRVPKSQIHARHPSLAGLIAAFMGERRLHG